MNSVTIEYLLKKFLGKPTIKVGRYTYGMEHVSIHFPDADLIIGNFVSIANDVHIFLGGNHHTEWISTFPFGHTEATIPLSQPIPNHPTGNKEVRIGNDVWIGAFATIMSGVTIGDGAVIAARSHVVTDVPAFSIYGGNPARCIRMRFHQDLIDALLEIKWWNLPDDSLKKLVPILSQPISEESIASLRKTIKRGF